MIKQFLVGVLTSLLLLFGGQPSPQTLGTTNYVQTQFFTLAGAGATVGATSIILKAFHNIDGTNLVMADFGTKGWGTIEPNNGTQEEQISFTGVTQNANGTATLTGVSTVLNKSPYTETSGTAVTHPGGVKFVISNTAGFYNTFANKGNNETITGRWTFNSIPVASSSVFIATNPNELVTLYTLNQATSSGGSNASTILKGVVQEATDSMLQSSSSTGSTGARTYANGGSFAQTSTANKVPVSNGSGKLDNNWLNGNVANGFATLDANTLVVQNPASATSTPTANAIVMADSLGKISNSWLNVNLYYGDGSDASTTLSSDTTSTRDMYYSNLTINNGVTLHPNGHRIFVQGSLTFLGTGKIAANGGPGGKGGDASGGTGGAAGTAGAPANATGTLPVGLPGVAGAAGNNAGAPTCANGSAGNNGLNQVISMGALGAAGGAGQDSADCTGGAAGGAGVSTTIAFGLPIRTAQGLFNLFDLFPSVTGYAGSVGSGSGGAGAPRSNGVSGGGGGGGSGAPGGTVWVAAKNIVTVNGNAYLQAKGGNGGNGGAAASAGGGGCGAAGAGGIVLVLSNSITGSGTVDVSPGTPGTQGNTGTPCASSATGTAFSISAL